MTRHVPLIAVSCVVLLVGSHVAGIGAAVVVEHNLGPGGSFTRAGKLRDFKALEGKLKLDRDSSSAEERAQFDKIVKEDGLYLLRMPSNPADPLSPMVTSTLRARCFLVAGLKEGIVAHIGPTGDQIVGLEHRLPRVAQKCEGASAVAEAPPNWQFQKAADVFISRPQRAPALSMNDILTTEEPSARQGRPAEATAGEDPSLMGEGVEARKRPPKKDERTWIQKNWILVLAGGMLVVNLLGSAGGQQGQGQGGEAAPARSRPGRGR